MDALPTRHVPRRRLVDLLTAEPVALVEAGGGFGKSVLVAELQERLGIATVTARLDGRSSPTGAIRHAARRAGLSDVAAALEVDGGADALAQALAREPAPVLVVVDEVQHADPPTVTLLRDLATGLPPGHRLVLVGRRLDPVLHALQNVPLVDAAALTFTPVELEHLVADPAHARQILAATAGWPAASALAAERLRRAPHLPLPAAGLGALVDGMLAAPDTDLAVLGHLPLLSDAVAAACAGEGALARLRATGLPVRPTSGGWLVLPDPVRDELAGRTPLPVAAGRAAGRHYALAAELRAAVTLLAGDPAGLAELLGEQRWPTLADLELGELGVLLAALPDDALADHPAALLSVARLAELSADMELRHGLLERALRLIAPGSALRREAEAEMALHEAIIEPGGAGGAATARALLGDLPPTEYVARIRALFAVAWIDAWRGDPPSMRRAEVALEEAAALCRLAREPEWEATALLGLGYRVCFARGDVDRGIDHMTRALALIPGTGHERASVSAFLATAQMYIGRFDEAESVLHEAEGIARTIGDHRAHAYVAWAWTVLSAMRGDRAATLQRIRSTERRFGPWYDHPTGSEFLTDAAVALTRVGDEQLAWEYAERAREHAAGQGYPEIALLATGAWHARFGDPAQAERDLTAYAASDQPRERDAWHLLLLRSHAAGRSGDAQAAAALAAEAHAAADALGYPQLPQLHEPDLVSAASVPAELGFAVRILGPFAVSAGGRAVVPPPGRPATLVKLLAASGPVALDAAVETLWPGTEAVTGRARLRNLLNRLRAACGDLVQRTDDGLRLAPGARIDAARFEAAAVAALAAPAMTRAGLARAALAGYGGELLPEDRYADWATAPRERLRRRQLELLDLLADDAVERGDVDEAIRLLERATEAEPLDEDRRLRAAELLLFQGRRGSAKTLVERAVAQRGELGIVPDRRLARLADAVGIGPLDARWTAGDQAPPHGHHLRAPAPGREPH